MSDRRTDYEMAAAERLIAGLIGNPTLVPVVVSMGLTDAHFPRGTGLQAPFRFAIAGRDCVEEHVASKYEDLSHHVLRRLARLRIALTVAEAKALAQHLLDPMAARIAADRRPGPANEVLRGGVSEKPTAKDQAVEFLRNALADGGMMVVDLEVEAMIAGLLKADQSISQCRPFRDAKKELGVVSVREGFGRDAKYFWRLAVHG